MEVGYFKSGKEWDDFLIEKKGSFLQSIGWGEFKKKYQKVWRFEIRKNGSVVAIAQAFEEKGPFYSYLFIPYGPVAERKEERNFLLKEIKAKIGKDFSFIKIEPKEEVTVGVNAFYRIEPWKTIILDLEGDILEKFSKNTRYNTRLAQKKGVEVEKEKDVASFYKLLLQTKTKQGFSTYPEEYFQELVKKENCLLFLAKHDGKPVAGNVIYFFGDMATCLHSTSDYSFRKIKPANLLRYEAMKYAKERGYGRFDSWGIDEKRFPGVTKFKRGFGGREVIYPQGKEVPVKRVKYFGYKALSLIKERRR